VSARLSGRAAGPWYREGLRFQCTRCGECCRGAPGYVWVTEAEVTRVASFLGMDRTTFRQEFVRLVGDRLSLKEREDGDCVFYRGGCLVYPVRPTQCAIFPFWETNLRTRDDWERLADECPGVNQGEVHPPSDVAMFLRMDGASTRRRPGSFPAVTAAVLAELQRLYGVLDRELGSLPGACERCGECCRFGDAVPTLYASPAEAALVLWWVGEEPRAVSRTCPFLADARCRVHPVRPIGCRTHFCRDDHRLEHQALHERFLGELKVVCRRALLEWRYERFLTLLGEAR
jgi:Fe-S-cluster containining protein